MFTTVKITGPVTVPFNFISTSVNNFEAIRVAGTSLFANRLWLTVELFGRMWLDWKVSSDPRLAGTGAGSWPPGGRNTDLPSSDL